MDNNVIVALISLVGTLGGSLGGILVSSKLTAYRIEQLEKRSKSTTNSRGECPWSKIKSRRFHGA